MLRRLLPLLALATGLIGLLSSGCAGYRLGTDAELAFSTLYIAPVEMRTLLPQAQPILANSLKSAFTENGRVTVVNSANDADAVLRITVRDYHREVATVRPGDTGLARKFIVTLNAEVTLLETKTGKEFFSKRAITVKRDVFTDSGQQQAEYQILPLLAQDLADKVSHAVLDTW